MEALYESLLDFLSQVVIPDWGELIALLPLGLAALAFLWFALTLRGFATAGPTRRAPARLKPLPPPGIHMPGGSYAPIFGAIGTAALMWGLVVGGNALLVGVAILVVTLLYWGREAIRDYDHDTREARASRKTALPAVVHPGPPAGVHMPGPSFRPVLGAIGTTALMAGLVFGGWVLAAGVIILVITLVGWLVDARAEFNKTVEADRTGHLENIPAPRWPKRLLQFTAVLFVLAVLVQTGVIPPQLPGGGPGPDGSPAPSGEGGPPLGTAFTIVAKDIAFDVLELAVPADTSFTIELRNEDSPGIPHDIDIRATDKSTLQDQDTVDGGASATYQYQGLPAGQYEFICSIHPVPSMTGTLSVR
jgi:plastocyanin